MNFNGYPVFDFDSHKVERYVDNLVTGNEKIQYLSCVQKVIRCADAVGHEIPDAFRIGFVEKVRECASVLITSKEIIKRSSEQTHEGGLEDYFKGAPLYGFDGRALEINMNNLPTLEQQAAYIIRIFQETFLAVTNNIDIPKDFVNKLAFAATTTQVNLTIQGGLKQERTLEELWNKFDFDEAKQHAEALPDAKAKIKYWIGIRTEYEQQDITDQLQSERFDQKCDLEIKKLEKLMALDVSSENQKESQAESEAVTRNPDFTTARQVLAIHYLFKYSKADQASNADVARFIEFLTGKNYKNIYKRVCNPLSARDKELTEDLRFIRDLFEKLRLTEIVKMISNEINSSSF